MNAKGLLVFFLSFLLLAGCAPAAAPTMAAPTGAAPTGAADASAAVSFDDPFAYCAAVGTVDAPDARYSGPEKPEQVLTGLMKASGASADAPLEMFRQGSFWRCMNSQVYACFVGANLPCQSKANTSTTPTAEMNEFCKANPNTEFLPAYLTGHDTVYAWTCQGEQAATSKQIFTVDGQGFIKEIWYMIVK